MIFTFIEQQYLDWYFAYEIWQHGLVPGFNFIQLRLHWIGLVTAGLPPKSLDQDTPLTLTVKLFLVGLSAPMVQVGKDITWQDSLILENEVSVLNNVLYADLTGVFLVVGCTLFISLVNCLSEIPRLMKVQLEFYRYYWAASLLFNLGGTSLNPFWLAIQC